MSKLLLPILAAVSLSAVAEPIRSMVAAAETGIPSQSSIPLPDGVTAVEYIESTDSQYIDIYTLTGEETKIKYYADFVSLSKSSSEQNFVVGVNRMGQVGPRIIVGLYNRFLYSCDSGNAVGSQGFAYNRRYTIDVTYDIDGSITSSINGGSPEVYNRTFYAVSGVHIQLMTALSAGRYNLVGRLSAFQMEVNDELVLDMIPVRVDDEGGNPIGAMYDLVSGSLFFNSGTGYFIIGPDKE